MKTLEEMTLQEMFDIAKAGMESQKWQKSSTSGVSCAYRGDNGTKCAIGYLIPNDLYSSDIEGRSFYDLVRVIKDETIYPLVKNLSTEKMGFLIKMQNAHDRSVSAQDRQNAFIRLAQNYDLEI